jgi:hypothetical protein
LRSKKRTPQYNARFYLDFELKTAFILRGPSFELKIKN